jgi:hypothetical protein
VTTGGKDVLAEFGTAPLALNPERFLLPEYVLWCETADLGHPKTGVDEHPNNEFLFGSFTGVRQRIGLLGSQRLPDILIGHVGPPRFHEFVIVWG